MTRIKPRQVPPCTHPHWLGVVAEHNKRGGEILEHGYKMY